MKKQLIKWASVAALATLMPVSLLTVGEFGVGQIQAAAEVNFDQGSMSDEDYVRSVLKQFNELDGYKSEMIDGLSNDTTTMIYDKASGGTKVTIELAASEFSDAMTVVQYIYDDGSMAADELVYLEATAKMMEAIDPEFVTKIETLREQMGDALVLTPPTEGAETSAANEVFLTEDVAFTEIVKDGDKVKATIDVEAYLAENAEMLGFYPEGTKYAMVYEIDPATASVTSTLTIDIDEEALAEESGDEIGISIASFLADTEVKVMMTATDEKVPSLTDLKTVTREEFTQLKADAGLEGY